VKRLANSHIWAALNQSVGVAALPVAHDSGGIAGERLLKWVAFRAGRSLTAISL
jgi:hypothetical protein